MNEPYTPEASLVYLPYTFISRLKFALRMQECIYDLSSFVQPRLVGLSSDLTYKFCLQET